LSNTIEYTKPKRAFEQEQRRLFTCLATAAAKKSVLDFVAEKKGRIELELRYDTS